jgi:hypothetical protein
MMPPNAQNILGTVVGTTEVTTPSATNATPTPIFSDDAVDSSLAEVAKTFHWREFGNGAANGGTGATHADASMLHTTTDNIAYVMDDGLTSFSLLDSKAWEGNVHPANNDDHWHLTFIGTGITIKSTYYAPDTHNIAQNLPYGTHILKGLRPSSGIPVYTIDGVTITMASGQTYADFEEVFIHQPKMPPIPENAVVIADYMLMADFVAQTASGIQNISKGVRLNGCSRDVFFDNTGGGSFDAVTPNANNRGLMVAFGTGGNSAGTNFCKLPFFGTNFVSTGYQHDTRMTISLDGVDKDSVATKNNDAARNSFAYLTTSVALGTYVAGAHNAASQAPNYEGFDIVSPIHTSSHYQTFETPYLHELVGGDRNMEQNNLVVTPDGKTWDEVTRDTSYISNVSVVTVNDRTDASADDVLNIYENWRGLVTSHNCFNKDFAIAYDRFICLKDGHYRLGGRAYVGAAGMVMRIFVNGNEVSRGYQAAGDNVLLNEVTAYLKRGDYFKILGKHYHSGSYVTYNHLTITKL